uniref:EG2771 n=1 Tax=Rhizophora mucronata TaxID=61149 RepID=A0A2P2KA89_RHIMU
MLLHEAQLLLTLSNCLSNTNIMNKENTKTKRKKKISGFLDYRATRSSSSSKLKFNVCNLKPEPCMTSTKLDATPAACTVVCFIS